MIVDHPSVLSTLLSFSQFEETVILLAELSQFPKVCRIVLQYIPIERLLGIARFCQREGKVVDQLIRIVFSCSKQENLKEQTVSEMFSFSHFCLTEKNVTRMNLYQFAVIYC
jgi:hypothetical protein